MIRELVSFTFLLIGAFFFLAGTVGLLRFPDVYTRIHPLAKADNLGLGFIVMSLLVSEENAFQAMELFLTWVLVLISSGVSSQLVADAAQRAGEEPWKAS